METYIYVALVLADVFCVLVCSLKIRQNREENLSRIKLLRKLQRERIALKRERVLTEDAIKRARGLQG